MKRNKKEMFADVPVEVARAARRVANNTYEYTDQDGAKVTRLHLTDVVKIYPDGSIILNSGGWRTPTTKDRMNEAMNRSPWLVWQKNKIWRVLSEQGTEFTYSDGIVLHPDGTVENAGPDVKRFAVLDKKINAYTKEYIAELFDGKVPAPSGGDCWYCYLRETESKSPLGEVTKNTDHLESHMSKDERYFVPSLLVRAIELFPVSQAALGVLGFYWKHHDQEPKWCKDIARDQLTKSLRRYLRRQFGLAA